MNKKAILCVDDETIIVMSMLQELRRHLGDKYIFESACNAESAFQVLEDMTDDGITVSMIITDWLMPGMKGDEFIMKAHGIYPGIQMIMITGHADDEAIERIKSEDCVCAVFTKPWATHELVKAIQEYSVTD